MTTRLSSVKLTMAMATLSLLATIPAAHAASVAGAGIELDGKYVGGYAITWDGESRDDLVRQLSKHYITFERDFTIPVDAKDPTLATLKGKIRLLSKIRGDRQAMASTTVLQLVKREDKWYVEPKSLEQALHPAKVGQIFKCASCGLVHKKCSSCGRGPEDHTKVNHPPVHEGCRGVGEIVSNVLDQAGLSLNGITYVLNGEQDILHEQRELARSGESRQRLGQEVQKIKDEIGKIHKKRKEISDWFAQQTGKLRDPARDARDRREANAMQKKDELLQAEQAKLEERAKLKQDETAKLRVSGFESVDAWVERSAALLRRYEELAKDQKVADAVAEAGKTYGKTYQLGPSLQFLTTLKALSKSLAKDPYCSSGMNRHQKYPNDVTVIVNGKEMRQVPIVDAPGPIMFSTTHAEKFGFTPSEDAATVDFTMDDGTVVKAWKVKLTSLQIGEWSFHDLEVLVLPENKGRVKLCPVIRMDFLKHYTYDISPVERRNIAITGLRFGQGKSTLSAGGQNQPEGEIEKQPF